MTTAAVSLLLLVIYWALNYGAKGRLHNVKLFKWLVDPKKAILPRLNLVMLFAAGFGLAQHWVANLIGWLNVDILGTGLKVFTALMVAGVILFIIDMFDGGGIKVSSYGIAFGMPIVAAASGGGLAAFVTSMSGGVNTWFATQLAGLV
ncbi:hypothetical protein [Sphaerimonospora mesophila]|uniref:hypothetical protein n=1 Tax=Sphaerimonospora mesophila TaxID=37483 RepID=UPI0006E3C505